jgi:hypothetical protein
MDTLHLTKSQLEAQLLRMGITETIREIDGAVEKSPLTAPSLLFIRQCLTDTIRQVNEAGRTKRT